MILMRGTVIILEKVVMEHWRVKFRAVNFHSVQGA